MNLVAEAINESYFKESSIFESSIQLAMQNTIRKINMQTLGVFLLLSRRTLQCVTVPLTFDYQALILAKFITEYTIIIPNCIMIILSLYGYNMV